jgi:GNAT superfamily N-acetyltransferase
MFKFTHLSNKKELCKQIADLTFKEWAEFYIKLSGIKTPEEWKETLDKLYVNNDQFPSGYVATDGDKLVGFVAAELNKAFKDEERPRLWLTNLYVVDEYRKKGVAKQMVESFSKVMREKYNVPAVYLWTHDPKLNDFYQKLGFIAMDTKTIEGYNFTIYKRELIPPPPPLIEPVHVLGLFVLIIIILLIRRGFHFIFWVLGIFQPKKVVVKIET